MGYFDFRSKFGNKKAKKSRTLCFFWIFVLGVILFANPLKAEDITDLGQFPIVFSYSTPSTSEIYQFIESDNLEIAEYTDNQALPMGNSEITTFSVIASGYYLEDNVEQSTVDTLESESQLVKEIQRKTKTKNGERSKKATVKSNIVKAAVSDDFLDPVPDVVPAVDQMNSFEFSSQQEEVFEIVENEEANYEYSVFEEGKDVDPVKEKALSFVYQTPEVMESPMESSSDYHGDEDREAESEVTEISLVEEIKNIVSPPAPEQSSEDMAQLPDVQEESSVEDSLVSAAAITAEPITGSGNMMSGSPVFYGGAPKDAAPVMDKGYVPGELIVKFKSEGPYALDACGECLINHRESFEHYLADGSDSIDRLNQYSRVRGAKAHFDRHGLNAQAALHKQRLKRQKMQGKFKTRTSRVKMAADSDLVDMTNVYVLEVPEDSDVETISKLYSDDPHVDFAQPNYKMKASAFPQDPPDDTLYAAYLWGLNNTGQVVGGQTGTVDSDIDAPETWAQNILGNGIVVAVNDTGLDEDHEDIIGRVWSNTGETAGNGIDDDGNGFIDDTRGWDFIDGDNDPSDGYGHGTHVAGTIAAVANNSKGIVGVAPSTKIMVTKGLDDFGGGTSLSLGNGIDYAVDNGADIINNSWGCSSRCPTDTFIEAKVQNAYAMGVVVVFSAGNESDDTAYYSPQNMDEPIVVAASDNQDDAASFSNFGTTVDIAAPGVDIVSLSANNGNNFIILTCGAACMVGTNYMIIGGTSMAAPHVAGAAALLLNHSKYNFTNAQIETILTGTSDDVGLSSIFGDGRLNANEALTLDKMEPDLPDTSDKDVEEGSEISFGVTSSDPNNDTLTLTARLANDDPVNTIGATFNDNGSGEGVFTWTPSNGQAGLDPTIVFRSTDTLGLYEEDAVTITVEAASVCGDGAVEGAEECDDGNTSSGDGCSAICQTEVCGNSRVDFGEECDDGNTDGGDGCSATCQDEICGDGKVDVGEECDDGNITPGDGCSAMCTIEVCGNGIEDFGEDCDDGNTTGGDGCSATCQDEVCGNGVQDVGEECDDGNTNNGDGCDSSCELENTCGDGVQEPGEQCDDGNTAPGDGCSATCQIEACGNGTVDFGEQCDDGNTTPLDGCDATCDLEYCGDGIVNDTNEQCDDGNIMPGDGCSGSCKMEVCGNGILDVGEGCDDGNTTPLDGCDDMCVDEYCGDGTVNDDGNEQCDDGNVAAGDGCSAICNDEVCGNTIVDPGEGCDDGNVNNGDGCSAVCVDEYCGDGIVNDTDEECDDGNIVGGDGCSAICNDEVCGNGILDPTEGCDDGNTDSLDGCSATCVDEFCGDGTVNDDGNEECDDGNTTAGDGCSATCLTEVCGNSITDPGEECDDGNTTDGDGCSDVCLLEFCGNSIVDPGEECDDGNSDELDGCDSNCLFAGYCGDGICEIHSGELCSTCAADCGMCRGLLPR